MIPGDNLSERVFDLSQYLIFDLNLPPALTFWLYILVPVLQNSATSTSFMVHGAGGGAQHWGSIPALQPQAPGSILSLGS